MTTTTTDRRQGVNSSAAVKVACRAATTAALTRSGEQTVDGVALVTGDRVLVKDQASGVENGIYVVDTGAWSRASDFDGYYDARRGTLVFVHSGTANQGWWYLSTSDPLTIGTTSLTFTRSSTALAVIAPYAQTLLDDTTAIAARATLGLDVIYKNVLDYGAVGDGTTDDTDAIQDAFDDIAAYERLVFPGLRYKTNGCITVTTDNIGVHFDNASFVMGDTGSSGTMTNASVGKIGFLFKEVQNLSITGLVRCVGQGTIGTTSLTGMVFDQCDNAKVPSTMYFERMAAGRMIFWCDTSQFGDVYSKDMNGLQTFEAPPTNSQGTTEVVVGCKHSTFGIAQGYDSRKPVRYLSVAYDASSNAIDNDICAFGATIGESASDDDESSVLAIRSAVDCTFGPVQGETTGRGLQFIQYSGDEDFSVDRNFVASLTGRFTGTAASTDGALVQESTSAVAMGTNHVGTVAVTAAGEFGIYISAGEMGIDDASVAGATRPVVGQDCTFNIGRLRVSGSAQSHVTIGKSCNFSADLIDLRGGTTGGVSGGIIYSTSFGTGSLGTVQIGKVKYAQGGVGTNLQHVVLDTVNGFESWYVGHIDGTGSSGQASFAGDTYSIKYGRLIGAAAPAAGTYSDGALVWNSAPASGGTPGWMCTTPGTPGTWKAMANLA